MVKAVAIAGFDTLAADVLVAALEGLGAGPIVCAGGPGGLPREVQAVLLHLGPAPDDGAEWREWTQAVSTRSLLLHLPMDHPTNTSRARALGASGWLSYDADVRVIAQQLAAAREGVARPGMAIVPRQRTGTALLTPRELQVLSHAARGHENADIAAEMGVSPNTVRTHMQNIFAKLDVSTRFAAVAAARSSGLLPHLAASSTGSC